MVPQAQVSASDGAIGQLEPLGVDGVGNYCNRVMRDTTEPRVYRQTLCHRDYPFGSSHRPNT